MRKLYLLYIFLLFFYSCGVKSSKIIGKKIDYNKLPYGVEFISDNIYINGISYEIISTFYHNKALIYVLNNEIIIDYYLSNFVDYENVVKLFQKGADYNDIIKKLGKPVTTHYASEEYDDVDKENDYIIVEYYGKTFIESLNVSFISRYKTTFIFNLDWKLDNIQRVRFGN